MFIEEMTKRFNPQSAEGFNATYCFKIEDQEYGLKIANGQFEILQEKIENPNITFTTDKATWSSIIEGKMPAQLAFMTGKLQVTGDLPLALKLANIFSLS